VFGGCNFLLPFARSPGLAIPFSELFFLNHPFFFFFIFPPPLGPNNTKYMVFLLSLFPLELFHLSDHWADSIPPFSPPIGAPFPPSPLPPFFSLTVFGRVIRAFSSNPPYLPFPPFFGSSPSQPQKFLGFSLFVNSSGISPTTALVSPFSFFFPPFFTYIFLPASKRLFQLSYCPNVVQPTGTPHVKPHTLNRVSNLLLQTPHFFSCQLTPLSKSPPKLAGLSRKPPPLAV